MCEEIAPNIRKDDSWVIYLWLTPLQRPHNWQHTAEIRFKVVASWKVGDQDKRKFLQHSWQKFSTVEERKRRSILKRQCHEKVLHFIIWGVALYNFTFTVCLSCIKKTDFLFSSPNWHARRIRIRLIRKPVFHRNDYILKSVTVKPFRGPLLTLKTIPDTLKCHIFLHTSTV